MKPTPFNQLLYSLTIAVGISLPPLAIAADLPGMPGFDARFKAMDADGDGKITAAEHAAGAQKMFNTMDLDKNGKVSAAEMNVAQPRPESDTAHEGLSSAEKIRTLDTNRDGLLSVQEHAAGSARMFSKMDLNQDRALTSDEVSAGHAKLMHRGTQ